MGYILAMNQGIEEVSMSALKAELGGEEPDVNAQDT